MRLQKKLSQSEKPDMKSKKVILDTNLWISYLISNRLTFIDNLVLDKKIILLFSQELIEEFISVARRPKFSKYFSDEKVSELLRLFDKYGVLIKVSSIVNECRDIKDNFLLNLAVDAEADYLVTGDLDLLVIKRIKKTKIITLSEFYDEFKIS